MRKQKGKKNVRNEIGGGALEMSEDGLRRQKRRLNQPCRPHLLLVKSSILDTRRQIIQSLSFHDIIEDALLIRQAVLPSRDPQHVPKR